MDQVLEVVVDARSPAGLRDRRVQYHANPRRCQPMTVAERRTTRAVAQPGHSRHSPTQNQRSARRTAAWAGSARIHPQLLTQRQVLEDERAGPAAEQKHDLE